MNPASQSCNQIDNLRTKEYFHLNKNEAKVCLDYCGFGLFSYLQQHSQLSKTAFTLSPISSDLKSHALYGAAAQGTAENDIKTSIMHYLNTPENEYTLVFTAGRGSAFRSLAESYPFETNRRLLTMFDHESQSVNWMAERAREMGAKVCSAKFMWPSLKVCDFEMMKALSKRKRGSKNGIFVFPVQSRVSGVRYDYKWMSLAKEWNWHVLLDAGSLGPNDMESLGLSLFRPDFIITSFYRVFGLDPTGFGCLLIKKSVLSCLKSRGNESGLEIVRIKSVVARNLSEETMAPRVFSGRYEVDGDNNSVIFEGRDIDEEADSIGEIMKSPIFSDDESSNSCSPWIYLGQSPSRSENSGRFGVKNLSFLGGKNHKRLKPKVLLSNRDYMGDDHVLSVSEDVNKIKKDSIEDAYESGIKRETEFEFTLFDKREGNNNEVGVSHSLGDEEPSKSLIHYVNSGKSSNKSSDDGRQDDSGYEDDQELKRMEPEIVCRHIDHINMIDMNKIGSRIRYLVDWLVGSLLHLRFPGSYGEHRVPLVYIYGPKINHERGVTVAFNVRDRIGGMIHPETVQKLADMNGIYLGVGFLSNIKFNGNYKEVDSSMCNFISNICHEIEDATIRLEVVIASLGFLTNFADVYKLWAFVARFLDPSFIETSET